MSAPKLLLDWGLLGKIESTYGTDPTPAAGSDGILLAEAPEVELTYLHDGTRGFSPGGTKAPFAAPSGPEAGFNAMAHAIGAGAAYSASDLPSVDVLLRAAGFGQTLDATGGAETVTYTPETDPANMESATFYVYRRGQEYQVNGAYAENMTISVDGVGIPEWEFPIVGIGNMPSDASVPSITSYPSVSLLPPRAINVGLDINGVTDLVMRGFTFELGREMAQRADDNSTTGHAGFAPGRRDPTFEIVVEAEPLSSFNPYTLRDNGTNFSISFTVGDTQYNKWTLTIGNAQIMTIGEDEDGPSAIWTLGVAPTPTTYGGNDDITILFD